MTVYGDWLRAMIDDLLRNYLRCAANMLVEETTGKWHYPKVISYDEKTGEFYEVRIRSLCCQGETAYTDRT